MATPDAYPDELSIPPDGQPATIAERDRGVLERWRERNAQRTHARLMSARSRRALAKWLRRTARDANDRRIRPGPEVLLRYRAAAVRYDLLEIAALLEQAHDPDPACMTALKQLLMNGDSPLYHPGVHVSELYAALYYIRAGLARTHSNHQSIERPRPDAVREERTDR